MINEKRQKKLREIVRNEIWVQDTFFRFLGVEIGGRMTVIMLSDETLFLHSPVELTEFVRLHLDRIGKVKYVVTPNDMHHIYVADYFTAYPNAKIYAAPGVIEKRQDLSFHYSLKDKPEQEWGADIDQMIFHGAPGSREVVFYHRHSRTLILTDLLVNIDEHCSPLTKGLAKLFKKFGRPVVKPDLSPSSQEIPLLKRSVEKILEWDFERIILAHGSIIDQQAKEKFRQAFQEMLEQ